jgi:hypothetical protein
MVLSFCDPSFKAGSVIVVQNMFCAMESRGVWSLPLFGGVLFLLGPFLALQKSG